MKINLKEIILPMTFVNCRKDNTGRNVTLHKIANLDFNVRRNLNFIADFHDETISFLTRKDLGVEHHQFVKQSQGEGHIHFFFMDNTGISYECCLTLQNEAEFNEIKSTYFQYLQSKH